MYDSIMSISARNALSRLSETVAERAWVPLPRRRLFRQLRVPRSAKSCRR